MKFRLDNNKLIIEGSSSEEIEQINGFLKEKEGSIFQLQKNDEALVFVNLGNRETVCNESINVLFSSGDKEIQMLSNLGHTPFVMDDIHYESVEGFWQSLKYEESERAEIRKLHGKEAKKAGKRIMYSKYISYNDQKIRVGSKEHWHLMEKACICKFNQHKEAQEILLNTGIRPLFHKPRKDSEVIPGPIMAGIWMNIRSKLRKEHNRTSEHLNIMDNYPTKG